MARFQGRIDQVLFGRNLITKCALKLNFLSKKNGLPKVIFSLMYKEKEHSGIPIPNDSNYLIQKELTSLNLLVHSFVNLSFSHEKLLGTKVG